MPEALVNIRLDHDQKLRQIISEVAKVANVEWARLIFGPTDAVAYVKAPRWIELETTVFNIGAVEGVLETDTRIMVPEKD